jgi:hypothetical protein
MRAPITGQANEESPMADDDKTRQVNVSSEAPQPGATGAGTQAGPPPAPKAPKQPGAGMTLPTPVVIIGAIVGVGALVFGFISFTGKNAEADDKKKAQDELESVERDLRDANTEIEAANEEIDELNTRVEDLSQQLGQSEEFAAALDQVLGSGATAADALYGCATTAYQFILNGLNAGGVFDPGQAQAVDDQCLSAEDQYNVFLDALNQLAAA